ncbi:MAG: sulfatase-like hydrolase/transferase [Aestuariibaculum sp.]
MLKYIIVGLSFLLFCCRTKQNGIPLPKKVIFILADDIGAEWIGAYGCTSQQTPNIDRLAEHGYVFDNFSSLPLCAPSRQTILTGTHQFRRHKYGNVMPNGSLTFLQILNKQGFKNGLFGKWDGFDRDIDLADFKIDDYAVFNKGNRRFWNPEIKENNLIKTYNKTDYGPDIYNSKLLDFISTNKDQKFFAYYAMALGHWPFVPTPNSQNKNETNWQTNFKDMVDYADKLIGKVISHLETLGIADETLIIFTTDNGTYPELTAQLNNNIAKGGKSYSILSGQHVPFIISYGKHFKHKRIKELSDFTDIFPTLMDVAQVKTLPENYTKPDGESLLPFLLQNKPRKKQYTLSYFGANNFRSDMRALHIRNERWKLYSDGRLVDIKNDPKEYHFTVGFNENDTQKEARKKLSNELDTYKTDTNFNYVKQLIATENGKIIACWNPKQIALKEASEIKIDFTPFITPNTNYRLEIQHFKGNGGVKVSNVELLKNNTVIASDNHISHSQTDFKNVYQFLITKDRTIYNLNCNQTLDATAKYELKFTVTQIQKGDSYGVVRLFAE